MTTRETYTTVGATRWTLLLIDGRGRIRRLRGLRQIAAACVGLILALICALAVFVMLWSQSSREHRRALSDLGQVQAQIGVLKADNQSLLARVVLAENRVQADAGAPPAAPRASRPDPARGTVPPVATPAPRPAVAPAEAAPAALPAATATRNAEPAAPEPPAEAVVPEETGLSAVGPVAVEKLTLSLEAGGRRVAARFVLRNTAKDPVEGRSVVVLRTDGDGRVWKTLPEVTLTDGKPQGDRGRRFSIRRYMNVKVDGDLAARGARLTAAEVYVFDEGGRLLNAQRFPVDLAVPAGSPPAGATESSTP